ncbi:MAG: hypothetical protein KDE34_18990 [Anaerolineales bacterium]|nr:hypothetical protein [Anaerolineales bacterium]
MCGRFALLTDGETLIEQFEVTQNAELLWPDRPVAHNPGTAISPRPGPSLMGSRLAQVYCLH